MTKQNESCFGDVKIVGCSIKMYDGTIHTVMGHSCHHNVVMKMREQGIEFNERCDQKGFMCSDGTWVNRKRALMIAMEAEQVKIARTPAQGLFSDEIWP